MGDFQSLLNHSMQMVSTVTMGNVSCLLSLSSEFSGSAPGSSSNISTTDALCCCEGTSDPEMEGGPADILLSSWGKCHCFFFLLGLRIWLAFRLMFFNVVLDFDASEEVLDFRMLHPLDFSPWLCHVEVLEGVLRIVRISGGWCHVYWAIADLIHQSFLVLEALRLL